MSFAEGPFDALDAMIERAARQEQDDLDRQSGQFLLDVMDATKEAGSAALFEILDRAHKAAMEAEAEADKPPEAEPR